MDNSAYALIGVLGTLLGIAGAVYSMVSASRNNAKWFGVIEQKINQMIEGLNEVKARLSKVEDDRTSMRQEIAMLRSELDGVKRSQDRCHDRLDKLMGGRDTGV